MLETDEATGCWNFTGAKNGLGYGVIGTGGKGAPMIGAHRAAWQELVGPIPPGNHIHHTCMNPSCCNPAHLMCVSPYEHKIVEPSSHKNRTHCKHGHPFSGDNLREIVRNGRVHRECRECGRRSALKNYYSKRGPKKERALKTHCKYGHPLLGENLSPAALAKGLRVCMACNNRRMQEQRLKDVEAFRKYQREYHRERRQRLKEQSQISSEASMPQ